MKFAVVFAVFFAASAFQVSAQSPEDDQDQPQYEDMQAGQEEGNDLGINILMHFMSQPSIQAIFESPAFMEFLLSPAGAPYRDMAIPMPSMGKRAAPQQQQQPADQATAAVRQSPGNTIQTIMSALLMSIFAVFLPVPAMG